jgi:membrane protease YdiL (CAAX protease family)
MRAAVQWALASGLFAFAIAAFWAANATRPSSAATIAAFLLFAALTGVTLSLSVDRWRDWLSARRLPLLVRFLAAPAVITIAVAVYSAAVGLPVGPRAAAFGGYLMLPPAIVVTPPGRSPGPARVLLAAVALWLPIEFDLLPALRLPPPDGFRAVSLIALTNALLLFLVACPLAQIGYTFQLRAPEIGTALLAALAFAVPAVPIGLATGFLEWQPRAEPAALLAAPLAIYLATAVPEELLFRGLIQRSLERAIGRAGLPVAAIIFGLAHLPDLRYVILASLAGLAYGWVYARTRRITASAVTHAVVNWIWLVLLGA